MKSIDKRNEFIGKYHILSKQLDLLLLIYERQLWKKSKENGGWSYGTQKQYAEILNVTERTLKNYYVFLSKNKLLYLKKNRNNRNKLQKIPKNIALELSDLLKDRGKNRGKIKGKKFPPTINRRALFIEILKELERDSKSLSPVATEECSDLLQTIMSEKSDSILSVIEFLKFYLKYSPSFLSGDLEVKPCPPAEQNSPPSQVESYLTDICKQFKIGGINYV